MIQAVKKVYRLLFNEKSRLNIKTNIRISKGFFLKGNNVECNVCGSTYSKFLSKGNVTKRESVLCPNCGSLERNRLLLFYLENETSFFHDGKKVLHFAPEEGLKKLFQKRKKKGEYVNGDINPNLADEVIDITSIPYPENSFDYIICSHVLGHVPDEQKAISDMFRVLKPTGIALIMTLLNKVDQPTFESEEIKTEKERLLTYGERDLVRLHGNDFKERLGKPGFHVEVLDYEKKLDQNTVNRFRLHNNSRGDFFICKKS